MKKSYAKIIKRTVTIFLIVFILLYTIPIPINRKLDAVEIKMDDPSYLETRTIHIKGNYRFNLLKANTFKGQIFVPEHEITSEEMLTVFSAENGDIGYEGLIEYRYENGTDVNGRPDYMDYA